MICLVTALLAIIACLVGFAPKIGCLVTTVDRPVLAGCLFLGCLVTAAPRLMIVRGLLGCRLDVSCISEISTVVNLAEVVEAFEAVEEVEGGLDVLTD